MAEDPTIESQVIAALRRISRAIDLHSRVLLQRAGLTVPQLAALQAVAELQPASVGRVARGIHLSLATVSGIFDRLERRGLVSRSRSGPDRRTVMVELTEAGIGMLESAPSLLQERFRRDLGKLEQWEQTQLLASLQRVAAMMDAEDVPADSAFDSGIVSLLPEHVSRYLTGGAACRDASSDPHRLPVAEAPGGDDVHRSPGPEAAGPAQEEKPCFESPAERHGH